MGRLQSFQPARSVNSQALREPTASPLFLEVWGAVGTIEAPEHTNARLHLVDCLYFFQDGRAVRAFLIDDGRAERLSSLKIVMRVRSS